MFLASCRAVMVRQSGQRGVTNQGRRKSEFTKQQMNRAAHELERILHTHTHVHIVYKYNCNIINAAPVPRLYVNYVNVSRSNVK